jgi:hypothetical protein
MSGCFPNNKCICSCHETGTKFIKMVMPPLGCCDCTSSIVSNNFIKNESFLIKEIQNLTIESGKIINQFNKQERKLNIILNDHHERIKDLECTMENMIKEFKELVIKLKEK